MTRPAYGSLDGHGLYGILTRDDEGRVICHECGRACEQLATHLRYSHGMSAALYREVHGLSTGTKLLGTATLAKLSESWRRHEAEHLARLDATRDVDAARSRNTAAAQWRPELIARRREAAAAQRRDLTSAQVASLGDITDMQGWADRARALIERDGVSVAAIARAVGMSTGGVDGRLRRYPASDRPARPARAVTHRRVAELRAYVAEHGGYPPVGSPLGGWLHSVRQRGIEDPSVVRKLEALPGWSWSDRLPGTGVERRAARWRARFESLERWAAGRGHAAPGIGQEWEGEQIGQWVHIQRKARKAGRLSPEQVALLEGLPGWLWRPPSGRAAAAWRAKHETD